MVLIGLPVRYIPHAAHDFLSEFATTGLAAIVGRVYPDGSADLMVFVPNKEPHWQDAVPLGTGPHTFGPISGPEPEIGAAVEAAEAAQAVADAPAATNVVELNPGTSAQAPPPPPPQDPPAGV